MIRTIGLAVLLILGVLGLACDEGIPVNTNGSNTKGQPTPEKGSDRITFDYPVYLFKDVKHVVNLELDYVEGKVVSKSSTSNENGIVTNTDQRPVDIPGAPTGFDIYVEATLVSVENLAEPKMISAGWQQYHKAFDQLDAPSWRWQVTLNDEANDSDPLYLKLILKFGFKPIGSPKSAPLQNEEIAWEGLLVSQVGLPFWVWILTYLSFPTGVFMSAVGFLKTRGVNDSTALAIEHDEVKASDDSATPATVDDEVQCTLYAPSEAKAGNEFLIQVFAHLREQADSLAEIVLMADENIKKRAVKDLDKKVRRGSMLTFELTLSDLEIDDPVQQHQWNGKVIEVPFIVSVPKDYESGTRFGKVVISEDNIPVGRLTFKLDVVRSLQIIEKETGAVNGVESERYRNAFISYASEDRPEVLERVQMLAAAQVRFFQDVLDFNPGERWENALYKHIDESDVVYLFWSKAASESKWVEKEILYAKSLRRDDQNARPDIIPIIIEGPPPVMPPQTLNFLHFNDKFLYFIKGAEAEQKIREKGK